MRRIILYDRPKLPGDAEKPAARGILGGARHDRRVPGAEEIRSGDDYVSRLVRYVPVETLGFTIFGTSFPGAKDVHIIAVIVIAAVGHMLWLYQQGRQYEAADRPTIRYYLLALAAFAAWVLGTCPRVDQLFRIDRTTAAIVCVGVAYLLPWVDPITHEWFDPAPPAAPAIRR